MKHTQGGAGVALTSRGLAAPHEGVLVVEVGGRARLGGVRPHCRFSDSGTDYLSESGMKRMSRWCSATMRPSPRARPEARGQEDREEEEVARLAAGRGGHPGAAQRGFA